MSTTDTDINTERGKCAECGKERPKEELEDKPTDRLLCDGCWHE